MHLNAAKAQAVLADTHRQAPPLRSSRLPLYHILSVLQEDLVYRLKKEGFERWDYYH